MNHCYLEEPFRSRWAACDPFVAVEALQGEVFRELEARRTLRTEIGGKTYFVKIHRGVGWREIVKNLLCLRLPVLGAANEWQAIRRLSALGVDTMHGVAFGQRGCNPARQHSFIVTEDLNPTVSLEDFCRDWPENPPPFRLKRALIRRVADMARKMHQGGVNHRDFYLCHFLLHLEPLPAPERLQDLRKSPLARREAADSTPVRQGEATTPAGFCVSPGLQLSLIDLHRAQIRPATPRRWRDKDLASLYFSALDIGLTRRDRLRFLRDYFDRPLRRVLHEEAALLRQLEREAERLQQRYQRKYA